MATGIDKDIFKVGEKVGLRGSVFIIKNIDGNFMELKLVPDSYPNVKKVLDNQTRM